MSVMAELHLDPSHRHTSVWTLVEVVEDELSVSRDSLAFSPIVLLTSLLFLTTSVT